MLVLFVSKILCSVMNLTIAIIYWISAKTNWAKEYDVVCFLVVLDSIFETLAHI